MGATGRGRSAGALGDGERDGAWWCREREEGWRRDWGRCCHRVLPDSASRQQAATWSTMGGAVVRSRSRSGSESSNNGDVVVAELWWWRICAQRGEGADGAVGGCVDSAGDCNRVGGWLTVDGWTVTDWRRCGQREAGRNTDRQPGWTGGRGGCDAQRAVNRLVLGSGRVIPAREAVAAQHSTCNNDCSGSDSRAARDRSPFSSLRTWYLSMQKMVFTSLNSQPYLSWSPGWSPGRSHAVASICSHQADAGRGRSTGVSQRELCGAWATAFRWRGPLWAGWQDGTGSPSQCTQLAQWGRPGLLDRLLPLSEPLRRQGHSQSVHLVASQPPTSPTSLRSDRPNGLFEVCRADTRLLLVYLVPGRGGPSLPWQERKPPDHAPSLAHR